MAAPLKLSVIIEAIDKTMAVKQADERVRRFADSARQAALGVTMMGGAIVAALGKGVSEFSRLETAMAEVSTLVDTTEVNIDNLTGAVRRLAVETGIAPEELAKGLYQTISAGIDAADAMEFMGVATRTAIGGITETRVAVDSLTTIINAWGKSAADATDASDMLFVGMKKGRTEVGPLGDSLRFVAGTAAALGISAEEVVAAISTITLAGFPAQQAARSLNMALMAFVQPSTEAAETARTLGIELNASSAQAQGLTGTMRVLSDATGGDVEQMAALIGSSEAARAIFALTGAGLEKLSDIMDEMGRRSGAGLGAALKNMATTGRRMLILKETMRGAWLEIGEAAVPLLEKLIPKVSAFLEKIIELADAHPWLTEKVVVASGAFGGLLLVIGPLLWMMPTLVSVGYKAASMFVALGGAAKGATVATTAAGTSMSALLWGPLAALVAIKLEWELIAGAAVRAAEAAGKYMEDIAPSEALSREAWEAEFVPRARAWKEAERYALAGYPEERQEEMRKHYPEEAWEALQRARKLGPRPESIPTEIPILRAKELQDLYARYLANIPAPPGGETAGKYAKSVLDPQLEKTRELKKQWEAQIGLLKLYGASQEKIAVAQEEVNRLTSKETDLLERMNDKAGLLNLLTQQRAAGVEPGATSVEEEKLKLAEQQLEIMKLSGSSADAIAQQEAKIRVLTAARIRMLEDEGKQIEANELYINALRSDEEKRLDLQREINQELEKQGQNLRQINRAEEWILGRRPGITGGPESLDLYAPSAEDTSWIQSMGGAGRRGAGLPPVTITRPRGEKVSSQIVHINFYGDVYGVKDLDDRIRVAARQVSYETQQQAVLQPA